jgi:FkbM family methyltransferase
MTEPVLWRGLWLPEDEHHLPQIMSSPGATTRKGFPTYQIQKFRHVMKWVRNRRLAVDVGAHAGLWSRHMAHDFRDVAAFEPVPGYAECWRRNMAEHPNATLHTIALGAERNTVSLAATPGLTVDTYIVPDGDDGVVASGRSMEPLDSLRLKEVDLLKIDCEGYEAFVIRGGEHTIRHWKPAIIVEQKPGKAQRYGLAETQAVAILQKWGAVLREELAGDYILSWGK